MKGGEETLKGGGGDHEGSVKVAKWLGLCPRPRWGSLQPSAHTPLLGVGMSRHTITFPPHLNPGSAPDLAKCKGTSFVSMYPYFAKWKGKYLNIRNFGFGQTRGPPPAFGFG